MRPSSVATCSSPASSSRATSTPCAGCCADWFSLASGGCTGRTRAISAAAPSPPRSPSAASPPPSTTLAGATATNASDAQRACTPSLVTPPGEATPCSSSSKTTRCSAGTTSGSSSSPARRAVGTPCATNTAEPPPNCYLPPPMPWPGAGPRAATGDDASNPSSPTYERSDRSQTSAKPERHGRPAGSRAHFLKLNATGFTEYRAPARLPSADQIRSEPAARSSGTRSAPLLRGPPPGHRCPQTRRRPPRAAQPPRFAVQLGTVRFLGTFLPDPADVPWAVAAHLAAQLDIADPGVLKQYATRDGTNRLHAGEIQRVDLGEDAGGSVERRLGACSFGSGEPRVSRNTLVVVAACSAHTGRCGGGSRPAGPPQPPTGTGCATHKSRAQSGTPPSGLTRPHGCYAEPWPSPAPIDSTGVRAGSRSQIPCKRLRRAFSSPRYAGTTLCRTSTLSSDSLPSRT